MSPVERPVVHRPNRENRCTPADFRSVSAAKEQRPQRTLFPDPATSASPNQPLVQRRVSRRTLDDIQAQMTDVDRGLLLHVQALRLVTGGQLRRVMPTPDGADPESAARMARRTLQRLREWRVLDRLPTRVAGGRRGGSDSYTWFVGPVGHRLLARLGHVGKRLATPSDRHLRHCVGIAELVTRLIEADRDGALELLAWQSEPACWRSFIGYGGARIVLKPDLSLRVAAGDIFEFRCMVEYDCATEGAAALTSKLKRHLDYRASGTEIADHGSDPVVLWVVPDDARVSLLRSLIRRLRPDEQELFAVTTHDEAVAYLAREARS